MEGRTHENPLQEVAALQYLSSQGHANVLTCTEVRIYHNCVCTLSFRVAARLRHNVPSAVLDAAAAFEPSAFFLARLRKFTQARAKRPFIVPRTTTQAAFLSEYTASHRYLGCCSLVYTTNLMRRINRVETGVARGLFALTAVWCGGVVCTGSSVVAPAFAFGESLEPTCWLCPCR